MSKCCVCVKLRDYNVACVSNQERYKTACLRVVNRTLLIYVFSFICASECMCGCDE